MFETVPTYDKYRTLSLQKPMLQGEDVYALQCALLSLDFLHEQPDGIYGPITDQSVYAAQRFFKLIADGKAGGLTQKALAMGIAETFANVLRVPVEAPLGQLEHESGFRLGIYSAVRSDGTYDAGVAQRNTKFTSPKEGFNPEPSIRVMLENTRKHFDLFVGVKPLRRRWALAQGAWNAPAFACYIAREEGATKVTGSMTARPSDSSRRTFEEYMTNVSKYLTV